MTKCNLHEVLKRHALWLANEEGGKRAYLSRLDLRGADFSGVNLRKAKLKETKLAGANFSGACLIDADLDSASLRGADLSMANLSGACLSSADLEGADLSCADLSAADLSYALLSGAHLREAKLGDANLDYATGVKHAQVSWNACRYEEVIQLTSVRIGNEDVYYFGDFQGSLSALHAHIAGGLDTNRADIARAADFVAACME